MDDTANSCICGTRTPYWPSQESRDIDSNYGCGDTASVSELNDSFNDTEQFGRHPINNMERCMSCISKLGALTMSRSSTATGIGTPNNPPTWTVLSEHLYMQQTSTMTSKSITPGADRMSMCSSHGSMGSGGSEYSVPRSIVAKSQDSWYEKIPSPQGQQQQLHHCVQTNRYQPSPCMCCPPRPPKPKQSQPIFAQVESLNANQPNKFCGPYENYDVPKPTIPLGTVGTENYDTPKKIQEYLTKDTNSNQQGSNAMLNYDMPLKMCGCLATNNDSSHSDKPTNEGRTNCTCNRVMSWADNWISLPYCRRGNGIENTTVPINKVKLNGEGKMPIFQAIDSNLTSLYATVDMAKKVNRRPTDKICECPHDELTEQQINTNYINLMPITSDTKTPQKEKQYFDPNVNYTNLEFAQSLENYENAKEVLLKAGLSIQELEKIQRPEKLCQKCGHIDMRNCTGRQNPAETAEESTAVKLPDYILMEPGKIIGKHPGYIPMTPAGSSVTIDSNSSTPPPLPSKSELLKRIIGEKSASNPTLCAPAVDRSKKRPEQDKRVPGSAMMLHLQSVGSPYKRKQLMDNSDLLPVDKRLMARKRSSSADSNRFLEDNDEFNSTETLRKTSIDNIEGRRSSSPCIHQETEHCLDEACCGVKNVTPLAPAETEDEASLSTLTSQNSQNSAHSVYIRRSASVPCKGQNRDSSSSNDSGVSTGSLKQRVRELADFELPLTTSMSARRHQRQVIPSNASSCVHASLPRRSKSFDPLREITFQFQKLKIPEKSTSAEAEVPICLPKPKEFRSPSEGASIAGPPYIDSRSTSSGTSDMSDYIETLSLSSHSSSDTPESLR